MSSSEVTSATTGTKTHTTGTKTHSSANSTEENQNKKSSSELTLAPPKAPSHTRLERWRKELEAREKLARLKLMEAEAEARLVRIQYEKGFKTLSEEDGSEYKTVPVQGGLRAPMDVKDKKEERTMEAPSAIVPNLHESSENQISKLVKAIKTTAVSGPAPPPSYVHDEDACELPFFKENSTEWLAFKRVYENTAPLFSNTQNMARLRSALRGAAKEAFKNILHSDTSPAEMETDINALRSRSRALDTLVIHELEKMKSLPKIKDSARDVCLFASLFNSGVATIKSLKKPQYLYSLEMKTVIEQKLSPIMKFKWYDYCAVHEDSEEPDLILISRFLEREADRCGAYAYMETVFTIGCE